MKIVEFGKENAPVLVLLHGGGLSWWNYQGVCERLAPKYHIVLPLLDGHAGSDCDFTTIQNAAVRLCAWIQQNYGQGVFAMGGLSLGGQILAEMLAICPNICKYAIIESALVLPMRFTNRLVGPMVNVSYGLIPKRWFAKLQFCQLHIRPELFELYYQDSCKIKKENMAAFLKSNSSYCVNDAIQNSTAKVLVAVGEKELPKMKKSAELLHQRLKGSELCVLPSYRHGDLSINHAERYAELLERLIAE